uniref:Putative pentatricopeptide repeat protein n=1 Tax=Helianthus annuus TaxID=4232 RepID=A0A251S2H5_HELAN
MIFVTLACGYQGFKSGWPGYKLSTGYFPYGVDGMLAGASTVFFSKKIFDKMVKKKVVITKETYSALIKGLCKKGNSSDIRECCDFIRNKNWLPTLNDYRTLINSLCKNNMVVESLSLFEHAMMDYPHELAFCSMSF